MLCTWGFWGFLHLTGEDFVWGSRFISATSPLQTLPTERVSIRTAEFFWPKWVDNKGQGQLCTLSRTRPLFGSDERTLHPLPPLPIRWRVGLRYLTILSNWWLESSQPLQVWGGALWSVPMGNSDRFKSSLDFNVFLNGRASNAATTKLKRITL